MVSLVVFDDAWMLLRDVAAGLGVPLSEENGRFKAPEPPAPWAHVEFVGDGSEPRELQGAFWVENGFVAVHVMVPTGTGQREAIRLREELSKAFRGLPPRVVVYDRFAFDPGGNDEDGNWYRATLRVFYRLQE